MFGQNSVWFSFCIVSSLTIWTQTLLLNFIFFLKNQHIVEKIWINHHDHKEAWLHLEPPGCAWVQEDGYFSEPHQGSTTQVYHLQLRTVALGIATWGRHVPVMEGFNWLVFVWSGLPNYICPLSLLSWKIRIKRSHIGPNACMKDAHAWKPNGPLSVRSPLTKEQYMSVTQVSWTRGGDQQIATQILETKGVQRSYKLFHISLVHIVQRKKSVWFFHDTRNMLRVPQIVPVFLVCCPFFLALAI